MQVKLTTQSYGKSRVYLTKVTRHADRHDIKELAIDLALEGDFTASYLTGDNRRVVATDTMKNTIYALAADHPLVDAESFAQTLAAHFVDRNAHVMAATVSATELSWQRIASPSGKNPYAFIAGGSEQRTCSIHRTRDTTTVHSGLLGLPLLKTTDSAFRDFLRDEFTTLADADDRIFATIVNAQWTYYPRTIDWNAAYEKARTALIDVFARHKSLSVQQTLFAMGQAALDACPDMRSIHLEMQNQHRIPVNLAPLGKPNRNEVFVTTREPYGLITATLERES